MRKSPELARLITREGARVTGPDKNGEGNLLPSRTHLGLHHPLCAVTPEEIDQVRSDRCAAGRGLCWCQIFGRIQLNQRGRGVV